jgi:RsmE family RNA methyltransferase
VAPSAAPGTDPSDPALGPFVLVADLARPALDDDDEHHVRRVRRLRPGDPVLAADGAGGWRTCRLGDGAVLAAAGPVHLQPAPTPPVTVGFALVKGARPELVVQKLTEVGVDRIVPFRAARSVVRWDERRAEAHHARLVRVAREAVAQCRRLWVPDVAPVARFEDLVGAAGGVALADLEGAGSPVPRRCWWVPKGWSPGAGVGCMRARLGPT